MHPDTDELLHVLEGSVSVEIYFTPGVSLHTNDPAAEPQNG